MFEEDQQKNEDEWTAERQKPEEEHSWQQVKHTRLYSDLRQARDHQALKERAFESSWFKEEGKKNVSVHGSLETTVSAHAEELSESTSELLSGS